MKAPRIALSIRAQLLLVLTRVPGAAVAGRGVRARTGARAAGRAGTHAGGHRAGRRHRAARPAAPVRDASRSHRAVRDRARQRSGQKRRAAAAVGFPRNRADHCRFVAHHGEDLGGRPGRNGAGARRHAQAPRSEATPASLGERVSRATFGWLYRMVLDQPSEDFTDDAATVGRRRVAMSRARSRGSSPRTGGPHPTPGR